MVRRGSLVPGGASSGAGDERSAPRDDQPERSHDAASELFPRRRRGDEGDGVGRVRGVRQTRPTPSARGGRGRPAQHRSGQRRGGDGREEEGVRRQKGQGTGGSPRAARQHLQRRRRLGPARLQAPLLRQELAQTRAHLRAAPVSEEGQGWSRARVQNRRGRQVPGARQVLHHRVPVGEDLGPTHRQRGRAPTKTSKEVDRPQGRHPRALSRGRARKGLPGCVRGGGEKRRTASASRAAGSGVHHGAVRHQAQGPGAAHLRGGSRDLSPGRGHGSAGKTTRRGRRAGCVGARHGRGDGG